MAGDSDPLEKQPEAAKVDQTTEGALGKLQEQSEHERKRSGLQRTDEQRQGDEQGQPTAGKGADTRGAAPKGPGSETYLWTDTPQSSSVGRLLPSSPPNRLLNKDLDTPPPAPRDGHPLSRAQLQEYGPSLSNPHGDQPPAPTPVPAADQQAPPGSGADGNFGKTHDGPGGSSGDASETPPQIPRAAPRAPAPVLDRPKNDAARYYDAMHLELKPSEPQRLVDEAIKRGDLGVGQSPAEQGSGAGNRESAPGKTQHPSGSGQSGQKVDAQSLGTADDELKKHIAERGAQQHQQPAPDGGIRQPSATGHANDVAGKIRKSVLADGDGPDNTIRGTKGFRAGSNPPADPARSPETKTVSSVPANANAGRPLDAPRETPRGGRIPPQPVSPAIPGKDAGRTPDIPPPSQSAQAAPNVGRTKADAPLSGQSPQQRPADRQDQTTKSHSDADRGQPVAQAGTERKAAAPDGGDRGAGPRDSTARASQAGDRGTTPPAHGQEREEIDDIRAEGAKGSQRGDQPTGTPARGEVQAIGSKQVTGAVGKGGKAGGDVPVVLPPGGPAIQFGGRATKQPPTGADGGSQGAKQVRESDSSSGKSRSTGNAESSAGAGAERGGASKIDKSGEAGSRPEPSSTKPDKGALAAGTGERAHVSGKGALAASTGEPAHASGKGTDAGSKGLGGPRDSGPGPGRTGSDGTKVGSDVKISGDAAGRSGADGSKIGPGTKDVGGAVKGGAGKIEGSGAGGAKSGARGIDIPFFLPPRLSGIDFGGKGSSKQGTEQGEKGTAKGGDSSASAATGSRGEKAGAAGGAGGERAADGSGKAGPGGTKAGFGAGESGTRVGSDGSIVPIVLPPGFPGVDLGGKGGLKSPGGTPPGDKPVAGAAQPADKSGSAVPPGKAGGKTASDTTKGSTREEPPAGRGDRGPSIPVAIPPGYGFDQTGKGSPRVPGTGQPSGRDDSAITPGKQSVESGGKTGTESVKDGPRDGPVPAGRGDRTPFIPVEIPARYGFDQIKGGGSRAPGADSGARTGHQAGPEAAGNSARGEKSTVPAAPPADRSLSQAQGTMSARQPGDKATHPGKDTAKDTTAADKTLDANAGQISGRMPPVGRRLTGLELPDSGSLELPRTLEWLSAANKYVQSRQVGEVPSTNNARHKSDAGQVDRRSAYEQVRRLGADFQNPEIRGLISRALLAYEHSKTSGIEAGIMRSPNLQAAGVVQEFRLRLSPEARTPLGDGSHDGTSPGDHALRPKFAGGDAASAGETARCLPLPEKTTDDRLLEFIKTNRQALKQAIQSQELNQALRDLAQIIQELEPVAVAENVGEAVEHELGAGSDQGTIAADRALIGSELHHMECGARTERQVYIVQEGDSLESIAEHLYADERIGALIHELNKDAIASTYLYDRIIIELRPGTALSLPTDAETGSFVEQIAGADVAVFEYSQNLDEAEQELVTWEASRSNVAHAVNPFATWQTEHIEDMLASLKPVSDPSESDASTQSNLECPPCLDD